MGRRCHLADAAGTPSHSFHLVFECGSFKKNQGMVTRATGTKEGDEQVCSSEIRSTRLFGRRDQKVDDQAAGLR